MAVAPSAFPVPVAFDEAEGLQFKKQNLSDSVATTTANDAGANTGDPDGGVGHPTVVLLRTEEEKREHKLAYNRSYQNNNRKLCCIRDCTKHEQYGYNGMCKKHYRQSLNNNDVATTTDIFTRYSRVENHYNVALCPISKSLSLLTQQNVDIDDEGHQITKRVAASKKKGRTEEASSNNTHRCRCQFLYKCSARWPNQDR